MPTPAWSVTDADGNLASAWIKQNRGTALRLSLLRLHIQEVADKISAGDESVEGRSVGLGYLQTYLADLMKREEAEAAVAGSGTGTRTFFTRGKAI